MNKIDTALNALTHIPTLDELKAADQDKLLQTVQCLGRWIREIDFELNARYAASKPYSLTNGDLTRSSS